MAGKTALDNMNLPGEATRSVADLLNDPTPEEINAAARSDVGDAPPRRGPGRPAGAKNKPKNGPASSTTKPSASVPPRPLTGAAATAAEKRAEADAAAARSERDMRIAAYTYFLDSKRVDYVKGAAMLTRLDAGFLFGPAADPADPTGQTAMVGADGRPVIILTQPGKMLAPSDADIKRIATAGARLGETPEGQRLIAWLEKYAPYFYVLTAAATVVMCGVNTLSVAAEIKKATAAAQAGQMVDYGTVPTQAPGEAAAEDGAPVEAPPRASGFVKPDAAAG